MYGLKILSVSLSHLTGSLTCRKMVLHGADGSTSPPKEVMLKKSIAFGRVRNRETWVQWQA
jgi:hypothetical protein